MGRNDVTTINGREFVSVEEFVRRMDTTRQTLEKRIRLGIIPIVRPYGKKMRYIDWELGSKAWNMNPPNKKNVEAQRIAKRKPKDDSFMVEKESPRKPRMEPASIPPMEKGSIQKEKLLDISDIDPKLLEDCTVNGTVDWDLAKKKITALTYAYDLDVKKGKYVEKAEVQMWAITLAKILESNLSSLPNRYASILEAEVVAMTRNITGKAVDVSDESKIKMKKLMDNVAPEIFKSIQETLKRFDEDEWKKFNENE